MITLSQPIVKDQVLVGVISIDVLLSRLEQLLRESTPGIGTLFLVNQHQQILASSVKEAGLRPKPMATQAGYRWHQERFSSSTPFLTPSSSCSIASLCLPCCGPCSVSPHQP